MVTTFIRSASSSTRGMWRFLQRACKTEVDVRLEALEHLLLKKNLHHSVGDGSRFMFTFVFIEHENWSFVLMSEECPEMAELPLSSAPALCNTPPASSPRKTESIVDTG